MKALPLTLSLVLAVNLAACSMSQRKPASVTIAVDSLKKIDTAVQIGVTRDQYFPLVLDAKLKVDAALPLLEDDTFRTHLTNALNAYIDAGTVWDASLRYRSDGQTGQQLRDIITRYSIQLNDQGAIADFDAAIKTVWQSARFHVKSLSEVET